MDIMEIVLWIRNHSVVPVLIVFVLIVIAHYAPGARARIQEHASIPLRDDR